MSGTKLAAVAGCAAIARAAGAALPQARPGGGADPGRPPDPRVIPSIPYATGDLVAEDSPSQN